MPFPLTARHINAERSRVSALVGRNTVAANAQIAARLRAQGRPVPARLTNLAGGGLPGQFDVNPFVAGPIPDSFPRSSIGGTIGGILGRVGRSVLGELLDPATIHAPTIPPFVGPPIPDPDIIAPQLPSGLPDPVSGVPTVVGTDMRIRGSSCECTYNTPSGALRGGRFKECPPGSGQFHCVPKRRRMNVLNPRALRRAVRRAQGFERFARKTIMVTRKVRLKKRRRAA